VPPVVTTTEIARPATEVFAYATDPSRFREWQKGVVDGHMYGEAVGATCVTTRRIGGASRPGNMAVLKQRMEAG
jgi:uncharacterized protein YndB with AHSA1/START domain